MRRRAMVVVALLCAAGAVTLWALPGGSAQGVSRPGTMRQLTTPEVELVARGRDLFLSGCAYCHGTDAEGVAGRAPTLHGAGEAAADFYLATGRMPLDQPGQEPTRNVPAYTPEDRRALVAYVGSLGGPRIPTVDPAAGDLAEGRELFTDQCAGCHTVTAKGGVVPGAIAPSLQQATPTQIAEAIRVGPHLMPVFRESQLDQHQLDSVTRYVLSTRRLDDEGGWGIGNIGPVPEGLVAWLLAGGALLLVIRLLGERNEG